MLFIAVQCVDGVHLLARQLEVENGNVLALDGVLLSVVHIVGLLMGSTLSFVIEVLGQACPIHN